MEEEGWETVTGNKRVIKKCCQDNGKTKTTGLPKVGESRLYLPPSKWLSQFWERVIRLAASECAVYKGRLRPYKISEVNLLEVASEVNRPEIRFMTTPGSQKYFLRVRGFTVRGGELYAQFALCQRFAVHSSIYLFQDGIRLEYDSLAVGQFTSMIRPAEALINYLNALGERRFQMSFELGELLLEEFGAHKRLWLSSGRGIWIDQRSLELINTIEQNTDHPSRKVAMIATQVEALEESLMEEKGKVIKSSDLEDGKTVEELKEEIEAEKEKKQNQTGAGPMLCSTAIEGAGDEDVTDSQTKRKMLNKIHASKEPFSLPVDENIRDIFKNIMAISDKFGDKDKNDPKVLSDLAMTVDALRDLIKEKKDQPIELEEDESGSVTRIKAHSLTGMAHTMLKMLEGKDVRAKRAAQKKEKNNEWTESFGWSGVEDIENLVSQPSGEEAQSNWGGSNQW